MIDRNEISPDFRIFLHYMYPYFWVAAVPILRRLVFSGVSLKTLPFEFYETLVLTFFVALAVLKTLRLSLKLSSSEIVLHEGILGRRETKIKNNENMILVIKSDPIRSLFKTDILEIYSPRKASKKPAVHIPISTEKSAEIERRFAKAPRTGGEKVGFRGAAAAAFGVSSAAAGLGIAVPIVNRLGTLLGHTATELLLPRSPEETFLRIRALLNISLKIPAVLLAVGYGVSFFKIFENSFGAQLFQKDDVLILKTGFWGRKRIFFNKNGVSCLAFKSGILLSVFGGRYISVETPSTGINRRFKLLIATNKAPVCRKECTEPVFCRKKSVSRKIRVPMIFFALFFGGFLACLFFFRGYSHAASALFGVTALFLISAAVKYRGYYRQFLSVEPNITLKTVGAFARHEITADTEKLAAVTLKQNCYDKKLQTCKVKLTVAGAKSPCPHIGFLNSKETAEKLNRKLGL